jgi:spermidine/putrescine-binding protein
MDIEKLVEGLRAGSLTRREFKQVLAGLGVGVAAVPMTRRPAHAEGEVMYFGWAGYETPEFHPSYTEKYGGPPEATFWADGDEAFQKLRQGFTPDVMHPCTESLVKWREAGFLSELDPQRLEWLPDMFGGLTDIQGSLHDGKRYFMPMDWGNSTVIYRTDLVAPEHADENLSWAILFDDWYKGRISSYDTIDNVKIAGLLLGYDNIFSMTEEQLVETRPLLEKQRDNSRFYWGDNSEIEQALASGELVAAYGWNDSYVRLREQGVPIALGIPKEGIFTWCCGLTIHSETKDLEASYDLINAMTSPQAGAYEIEYWGFGHANKKAFDLVSDEVLFDLGLSTPEAMLNNGIYFEAVGPQFEESYVRLFDEVKSGF